MTRIRAIAALALFCLAIPIIAQIPQEKVDLDGIYKIKDEGLNRSQVMDTLSYLYGCVRRPIDRLSANQGGRRVEQDKADPMGTGECSSRIVGPLWPRLGQREIFGASYFSSRNLLFDRLSESVDTWNHRPGDGGRRNCCDQQRAGLREIPWATPRKIRNDRGQPRLSP